MIFPTHYRAPHARIRIWQRFLIATVITCWALAAATANAQVDIVIKDCPSDVGNQPDNACYDYYYNSPDIWIRKNPDSGTVHQNPTAGSNCYVYVRLTNIGATDLGSGVVHVYFGSASVSLGNWPSRWVSYAPGGVIKGNEIGSLCVSDIHAGNDAIVSIPWYNVPGNTSGDHWCLVARFVSAEDPMAFAEGLYIHDNVMNNNNIGWKNLTSITPSSNSGTIDIYNGHYRCDETSISTIHFDVAEGDDALLDYTTIKVDLGADGMALWEANNKKGTGIVEADEENTIKITDAHSTIELELGPEQGFAAEVRVEYNPNIPAADADKVYGWNITQTEAGRTDVLGGEAYEIYLADREELQGKAVRRSQPTIGNRLDLNVRPNIAAEATTIVYSLPLATRATLGIYNAKGELVRMLMNNDMRNAGAGELTWDGTGADGMMVPNGTYFSRLATPEGNVEKQIKIVR